MEYNLSRFIEAQERDYKCALSEIRNGRKLSHWMWYIFPQLKGLGFSSLSEYYGIQDLDEARLFLENSFLGANLIEITEALLSLDTDDATAVMGTHDDKKLKSCMTLFSVVSEADVFRRALDKFFQGKKDNRTLKMLGL